MKGGAELRREVERAELNLAEREALALEQSAVSSALESLADRLRVEVSTKSGNLEEVWNALSEAAARRLAEVQVAKHAQVTAHTRLADYSRSMARVVELREWGVMAALAC